MGKFLGLDHFWLLASTGLPPRLRSMNPRPSNLRARSPLCICKARRAYSSARREAKIVRTSIGLPGSFPAKSRFFSRIETDQSIQSPMVMDCCSPSAAITVAASYRCRTGGAARSITVMMRLDIYRKRRILLATSGVMNMERTACWGEH